MAETNSMGTAQGAVSHLAPGVSRLDRWLVQRFLRAIGEPELRVVLWDGQALVRPGGTPATTMLIHERAALWRLCSNPLLNFGDDYSAGRIEIEGGLVHFMEVVYRDLETSPVVRRRAARRPADRNSLGSARRNIHHHYDIGNEFYRLWLDREMLYTCAYYPTATTSLEAAQLAKMELVCRKLRLQPGQTVVEAGCGWGGLARYMAKQYRVKVRAFNISHQQVVYARERAAAEGLGEMVEYVEGDYREITGSYDAFVSVGMLEHVGPQHFQELGRVIAGCLRPEGLGLIHSIGQNRPAPLNPWLLKRIFPGSYLPTLGEMMSLFEPWDFSVLDVENLRLHYAHTLEDWLARFEANREQVAAMFDEDFVRTWRLYLAAATANFRLGQLQLFQAVFSRAGNNRIPLTRDHLTGSPGPA